MPSSVEKILLWRLGISLHSPSSDNVPVFGAFRRTWLQWYCYSIHVSISQWQRFTSVQDTLSQSSNRVRILFRSFTCPSCDSERLVTSSCPACFLIFIEGVWIVLEMLEESTIIIICYGAEWFPSILAINFYPYDSRILWFLDSSICRGVNEKSRKCEKVLTSLSLWSFLDRRNHEYEPSIPQISHYQFSVQVRQSYGVCSAESFLCLAEGLMNILMHVSDA